MENVSISELLFADDTLIFAAPGHSLDAFLWAIEAVSGVYGLKLNRSKCARISLKEVPDNYFTNGEKVPQADKTEYLGGVISCRADPAEEVRKRLWGASYVWQKLNVFWRDGLLSKKERIIIYDALVGAKMLYGLHTLPLKDSCLKAVDAFHLKGLRRILKLPITYTNEFVLKRAEEEVNISRNLIGLNSVFSL